MVQSPYEQQTLLAATVAEIHKINGCLLYINPHLTEVR